MYMYVYIYIYDILYVLYLMHSLGYTIMLHVIITIGYTHVI